MAQLIDGIHKTSKYESEDVISNIPDIAITNILDRLPLVDAVRTSALSRNWRFKWTMLSQLVIDDSFMESCTRKNNKTSLVISRILLHLRGAITKFVISICGIYFGEVPHEDISHWIILLSRKGITDLTLEFPSPLIDKLPTHLFSCLELKHLNLRNCSFHPPPTFHGFPNLLSLKLHVDFKEDIELVKLFTRCPLLEVLKLYDAYGYSYTCPEGKVKLVEIAELKNLKILSLSCCDFADTNITSSSIIFKLVGSLLKLQELDLDFDSFELTEDVSKKRFSTTFPSLKTLKLSRMRLDHGWVSCALDLIMSFPNLQTLEISIGGMNVDPSPMVENNTMRLFQLRRVVLKHFKTSEDEVCLIKCLLACSPFLQRIVIHPLLFLSSKKKMRFAMKVLELPRASTAAKIDFFGLRL